MLSNIFIHFVNLAVEEENCIKRRNSSWNAKWEMYAEIKHCKTTKSITS